MAQLIATFKPFLQGSVELYEDKVIIKKAGVATTRYLHQLTGIQYLKARVPLVISGSLHFATAGSSMRQVGSFKRVTEEATIMFGTGDNKKALEFKELVEQQIAKVMQPNAAVIQASEADEIVKYKVLLDQGAITQNEFDMKKKQLLGL